MQADLQDWTQYAHWNGGKKTGFRWILVVIDCFSRMAYTRPLKRKTVEETSRALKSIFFQFPWIPKFFYSDKGNEFNKKSPLIKDLLIKKYKMKLYNMTGPTKNPIVERWNRTFSNDLMRYFATQEDKSNRKNYKWFHVLNDLTNNINNRVNRSIGMKPSEVNDSNVDQVRRKLYDNLPPIKCKLAKGDIVRIPIPRKTFDKGYTQSKAKAKNSQIIILLRLV